MNSAQSQIFALFQALPPDERQDMLTRLVETFDEVKLTTDQIAAIDEGLAQMRRGDVIESDELFDRLAHKFGFKRA